MALFSLVWLNEISARKIIVKNSCGMKVYAAHAANNNAGSKVDGQSGVYGWEIPNDGSSTLDVPEDCEFFFDFLDCSSSLRRGCGVGCD